MNGQGYRSRRSEVSLGVWPNHVPKAASFLVLTVVLALSVAELLKAHAAIGLALALWSGILAVLLWAGANATFAGRAPNDGVIDRGEPALLAALTLLPLAAILTIALPRGRLDASGWLVLVAATQTIAALLAKRAAGWTWADLGLRCPKGWRGATIDVVTIASGVGLGYLLFHQSLELPLATKAPDAPGGVVLLIAAIVGAAVAEELTMRGVVLRAGVDVFGRGVAIGLVALLSATIAFEAGWRPAALAGISGMVLATSVVFGGSLWGATLARAAALAGSLVIFPILAGGG